jgi:hypothetical protein
VFQKTKGRLKSFQTAFGFSILMCAFAAELVAV